MGRVRSPKRRVRDDDFILGYRRIILESSFYWRKHFRHFHLKSAHKNFLAGAVFGEVGRWLCLLCALEMTLHFWRRSLMTFILVFVVRLEGDFSWQAQQFVTFWEIAGAPNVVFFRRKCVSRMGRVRSPKRRVQDDDFILGHRRIILGYFYWRKHSDTFIWNLRLKIFWQAQYLVRLDGDFACSAHWKWRYISDADHWWHSFCVAGAVFGEVRGWLCLLRAL